jgi:hypothetical protein
MAAITTAYDTYGVKGIREDLTNDIYNISPEDTPVLSMAGRESVRNTLHEWQTDTLEAAVTTNKVVEGDDISTTVFPAVAATARVGNYTQISRKLIAINDTLEAVDKAGRASEKAYQLAKRSAELKRDMEYTINSMQAGNAGGPTTARATACLGAWLKSNTYFDATTTPGVDPTYTAGVPDTARTDGTQVAYTETILKYVVAAGWSSGADVSRWVHLLGPVNKAKASAFSGVATATYNQNTPKPFAIIGSADIYVSEFGTFTIKANRFQRERDGWFLDPRYLKVGYLRPFKMVPLAKTGDAEKMMLLAEWTLVVSNEAAHGASYDLTTT